MECVLFCNFPEPKVVDPEVKLMNMTFFGRSCGEAQELKFLRMAWRSAESLAVERGISVFFLAGQRMTATSIWTKLWRPEKRPGRPKRQADQGEIPLFQGDLGW